MAAHRYWRLFVSPRSSNGPVLNEVEMRLTPGGSDVTGSGAASTSDTNNGPAVNLFDDNPLTNGGTSGGSFYWASYDFGAPVLIKEFAVTAATSAFPAASYGPGLCWAAYSDDNINFIRVSDIVDLSGLGDSGTGEITWVEDDLAETPTAARGSNSFTLGDLGPGKFTAVGRILGFDGENGGAYEIAGTVAIDDSPDVPVRRKVRLFRLDSGAVVGEVWSDPGTGAYKFENLKSQKYFVVAHDHTLDYNAVIKDAITPELPT